MRQDPANGAGKARPADRRLDMAGPLRGKERHFDEAALGDARLPEGIGEHLRRVLWPGRGAADKMAENLIAAWVGVAAAAHEIRLTESPEQAHQGVQAAAPAQLEGGQGRRSRQVPALDLHSDDALPAALDQFGKQRILLRQRRRLTAALLVQILEGIPAILITQAQQLVQQIGFGRGACSMSCQDFRQLRAIGLAAGAGSSIQRSRCHNRT